MDETDCHKVLKMALDADEAGNKEMAIEYYTRSVELILAITDRERRAKFDKFANQALERAEELKGIKYEPTRQTIPVVQSAGVDDVKLEVTGNLHSYTAEEKRVLEFTSNINSKIYVPFMDIDLRDKFIFPIPFTDKVIITMGNCNHQNQI